VQVDIALPEVPVRVAFDRAARHSGAQSRDLEQAEALAEAGWVLVRVRKSPCRLCSPTIVSCPLLRTRPWWSRQPWLGSPTRQLPLPRAARSAPWPAGPTPRAL
jgi:hypothetical protein